MPFDSCCSDAEVNGLIIFALILIAGFVYWRTNCWIVGEAKAISGHTIEVGKDKRRVRIHAIYSLQPPYGDEAGQTWRDGAGAKHDGGVIARGMLAERIAGKTVKVRLCLQQRRDPFGREVGQVLIDCDDVGLSMVSEGYAFADRQEIDRNRKLLKRYRRAETKAKKSGEGFHTGEYDDPLAWIKQRIEESFKGFTDEPEALARRDPNAFLQLAETVAKEIGEDMVTEWAVEFLFLL